MKTFLLVLLLSFSLSAEVTRFTDQDGKPYDPDSTWLGDYVVFSLAYTTCPTTCSFTVQNLKKLEKEFPKNLTQPRFAVVTIDPATDTPAKLKEFQKKHGVKWDFFTGDIKNIRALLQKYELSFGEKGAADSHIMHPNTILLLSPSGKMISSVTGANPDFKNMIETFRNSKSSSKIK